MSSSEKKQSKKKRARSEKASEEVATNENDAADTSDKKKKTAKGPKTSKKNKLPLVGLTLAISTLDVKGQQHENRDLSYKTIQKLCIELGAKVTGQAHKRVSALLCTVTSLENATQRVRKAVKHDIPLIDVAWLYECQKQQKRIPLEGDYVLDKSLVSEKKKEGGCNPDYEEVPEKGWSEPVEFGCCCVCHENMDPECPWCADCSINRSKKRRKVKT
jgi:hypothetical protein